MLTLHIYKTTNRVNGKIYIGKSIRYSDSYYGSGTLILRAIEKYGISNFQKEVIDHAETIEQLDHKEKFWISYYNSTNLQIGYNISLGGTGGDNITNNPRYHEICEIYSKSAKARAARCPPHKIVHDENAIASISYKNKIHAANRNLSMTKEEKREKYGNCGENNPMFGKTHSDEIKIKIGNNNKGKSPSKCAITNIPLGSVSTDDPRWKTGEIVGMTKGMPSPLKGHPSERRGEKHHYFGKKRDPETIEKIKKTREKNGTTSKGKNNGNYREIDDATLNWIINYVKTTPTNINFIAYRTSLTASIVERILHENKLTTVPCKTEKRTTTNEYIWIYDLIFIKKYPKIKVYEITHIGPDRINRIVKELKNETLE